MRTLPRAPRRFPLSPIALLVVALALAAAPAEAQTSSTTGSTSTTGGSTTTSTTAGTTTTTASASGSGTTTTSGTGGSTTSTTATGSGTAPSGPYLEPVDITFPTEASARFTDDYDAPRSGGRVHKASDIIGTKTLKLFAARAGTLCFLTGFDAPPPSYGVMATVCGDDGREYHYVHINNDTPGTDDGAGGPEFAFAPGVKKNATVTRGQWIGTMGDSGNAEGTSPHLHFEIEDPTITDPYGTHQRNPFASLKAAADRKDYPQPPPASLDPIGRVAGADRVATSIALAARLATAPAVVVASGDRVADSLAAGPLAAALDGPVLLNLGKWLDGRVVTEINRLRPTRIVLVGGPLSISPDIESELRSRFPSTSVERLAGTDRYETAATVATVVWNTSSRREAVLALGDHADPARAWPDALTAGWLGALTARPVLLTAPGALPEATRSALSGVTSAKVVGGETPVPPSVYNAIDAVAGTVIRLAGADRYATALKVADAGIAEGATITHIRAVTGRSPGDALAAGASAADEKAVMVLIDGLEQRSDLAASYWLRPRAERILSAVVIGGPVVMTEAASSRLARRIT